MKGGNTMAFYKVQISETYTYNAIIDADDIDKLDEVIHNEIPILVDMGEQCIDAIKEHGNGLHLEFKYDADEVGEDENINKIKKTYVDLTTDSTFFD